MNLSSLYQPYKFQAIFKSGLISVGMLLAALLSGCVSTPAPDNSAFVAAKPRSILVLPPVNNSVEVNAPYVYLSSVTAPLAERGYYVFPVAVIDELMKQNGLPMPEDMREVPLNKINEIIGPDAVLYIDILDWGQKFELFNSRAVVSVRGRLVDARSGAQLWSGSASAVDAPDNSNSGLLGMLASAVITQIAGKLSDKTPRLARMANSQLFYTPGKGFIEGPYRVAANEANAR